MKKFLFTVVAIYTMTTTYGQVKKQVVNVEPFSYSSIFSTDEVEIVRNNVIMSLQNTKRIEIVDLAAQNAVVRESERRKAEAAMNDNREMKDITLLNANYILRGNLNAIEQETKTLQNLKGESYTLYITTVSYTLSLLDPATGATVYSNNYEAKSQNKSNFDRQGAINATSREMKRFIEECFPVKGKILAMADGNEKKAKTVYIDLGTDFGIEKGQKFIVYEVIDIAGERSEKEFGTLTVQEVMSGSRSVAKVNDGGNEIVKLLKENKEITIMSRARKGLFGDQ